MWGVAAENPEKKMIVLSRRHSSKSKRAPFSISGQRGFSHSDWSMTVAIKNHTGIARRNNQFQTKFVIANNGKIWKMEICIITWWL